MGFIRGLVNYNGNLPSALQAGEGMLANFGPLVNNLDASLVLTVADLSGGYIYQGATITATRLFVLPTAAAILAAWPSMGIGDSFPFVVTNAQTAAFTLAVGLGSGITQAGTAGFSNIANLSSRIFLLQKTSSSTLLLY